MITFIKNKFMLLGMVFMLGCISGCFILQKERLHVRGGEKVIYQCGTGYRITAKYYSLSDGSLNFVKMIMADGKEQTLPQALSASGARYTDDRELVWWIKGDSARLEIRDGEGNWRLKYGNCKVVSDEK